MALPPIVLDYESGVPVYRQIHDAVVEALAHQQLSPDEPLPPIHQLARELDVNPNTVARAYRELEQSGHVVAQRGRGTFPVPLSGAPATSAARASQLRKIAARALAECVRQGFTAADLVSAFKKKRTP